MLVIAFDGIIFDTIEARALVVQESLAAEALLVDADVVREFVAGRTFPEAVRAVASHAAVQQSLRALDETSLDIASLRAQQSYSAIAMRGFSLNTRARDLLQRAAAVTRIVVRADSRRREVEVLLAMAGLDTLAHMTRCSDDPGARPTHQHGAQPHLVSASSPDCFAFAMQRSYDGIRQRTTQNGGLLGESCRTGIALEASALGTTIAAKAGFDTAPSLSALNIPGL